MVLDLSEIVCTEYGVQILNLMSITEYCVIRIFRRLPLGCTLGLSTLVLAEWGQTSQVPVSGPTCRAELQLSPNWRSRRLAQNVNSCFATAGSRYHHSRTEQVTSSLQKPGHSLFNGNMADTSQGDDVKSNKRTHADLTGEDGSGTSRRQPVSERIMYPLMRE